LTRDAAATAAAAHHMTRRIALAILLTVWAILIAGCATAYLTMRSVLIDQLDQSLKAKAQSLPELARFAAAGSAADANDDQRPVPTAVRNAPVLADAATALHGDRYVIKNAAGQTLSPAAGGLSASDIEIITASFATLNDGTRVRSLILRATVPAAGSAPVALTISYQSSALTLDRLLDRLALSFVLFGISAGLIAALVATSVSRAALKPLHATADVIGTIDPANLHRRIEAAQLPPELVPMASRLNEMLERIEHAYAQRQQFLADASHELRTPVAALVTTAEVSLRHPRDAQAYRVAIESCLDDARLLRRLVERLMEQCRADTLSHDETPEEIDITPLLDQCADQASAIAGERSVTVLRQIPGSLIVTTQPQRMRSVVMNLLANAVEYNRPGGQVELIAALDAYALHLSVRDTGPGIAAEHIPHLFEPFYRADKSRSGEAGHLGLGLSLVQSHLQALGGVIRIQSVPGVGTMFSVDLPLSKTPNKQLAGALI
jgi:heavy metal sensor kinase